MAATRTPPTTPLSPAQIYSVAAVLLGLGITWTVVVAYRFQAKGIDGEWGNLLLASTGLGFGFATLYAAFRPTRKLVSALIIGAVASACLLIALGFYSHAL